MTNYNESDWIPASATSLSQVNYCVDDSYLTPQISCADPVSFPPTPASARPRSSSGFYAQDMEIYNRPRSRSAGMYTPHVNDFDYSPNPLGIKQDGVEDMNFPGVPYINPPVPMRSAATYQPSISIPEVSVTSSRLAPIPIAPNPAGLQKINTLKRGRGDESPPDSTIKRRRRSSVNTYNLELSDEERLLLRLKDEVNLPWKDIALRFQLELGKNHQVPALQMRYKRLRERLRAWTEADVDALQQARDYWEKFKWDIIATKMLDYGCGEKWPAKYCLRKWEELHPELDMRGERTGSGDGSPELLTPRPQ